MNKSLGKVMHAFNALSLRERVIVVGAVLISMLFVWWNFYVDPRLQQTSALEQSNETLKTDIKVATIGNQAITQRLAQGVNREKQAKLEKNRIELQRTNEQLQAKAYELVEPNEMFDLMGHLVFAESGLELGELKRKSVAPIFAQPKPEAADEKVREQPTIYRHTMSVNLSGSYPDILRYLKTVEQTDWKLIWDSIQLETIEYPKIEVNLELSTLSKSQQWVGL